MVACHTCLTAELHMQYEQTVAGLKATKGLTQLSKAGLQLNEQIALFSQYRGPKFELRSLQQSLAFEALKDDMVSRTCESASRLPEAS